MDILSKCSPDQAFKLVHGVLDGICERKQPVFFADYSEVLSLEEWWQVKVETRTFCLRHFRNKMSRDQTVEYLSNLSTAHQEAILEALSVRSDDVHQALLCATNSVSETILQDFDWKIKLAVASDKVAMIHQPLLMLHLNINRSGSSQLASIEMNPEELSKLLAALEGANRALMLLKTS